MRQSTKRMLSRLGGIGVLLVAFVGKLKYLLPLLKFGKFGGTIVTMAISLGAYALIYPLEFALGLILMIFIHEMGHVLAAKQKGLPVSAPSFIPFVGALITMKKQPADAVTEAYIAYGGPLIGSLGALACFGIGVWTGNSLFHVIAMIGFFLNLINLLPMHPLDGGRIVGAITRWVWVVGVVLGPIVIIYLKSFILGVVYALFVWELWMTYRKPKQPSKVLAGLKVDVDQSFFTESHTMIPGEKHRRELEFTQQREEDGTYTVEIMYPGIGSIVIAEELPSEIQAVHLVKTMQNGEKVQMYLELTHMASPTIGGIQREDTYYQIPIGTRVGFGVAYVGLIIFLVYMLYVLRDIGTQF